MNRDKNFDFNFPKQAFEKVGGAKVSTYSSDWEMDIVKKLSEERPYVLEANDYTIIFKETDADRGYGFGSLLVANVPPYPKIYNAEGYNGMAPDAQPGAPSVYEDSKKAFIPVIIKDFKLADMDIFVFESQPHALTKYNWTKFMNQSGNFGHAVRVPLQSSGQGYTFDETLDKTNPPFTSGRQVYRSSGLLAYGSAGMSKQANPSDEPVVKPLIDQVLPTISKEHRERLEEHVGETETLAPFAGTPTLNTIDRILKGKPLTASDKYEAYKGNLKPNIVRIKTQGGDRYAVTEISDWVFDPKTKEMHLDDVLKQYTKRIPQLGPQLANSQIGKSVIATIDHGERDLIVLEEWKAEPKILTESGDYMAMSQDGSFVSGNLCTNVYDPTGELCGHHVFISGDQYAFMSGIAGEPARKPTDLKEGSIQPGTTGTFYFMKDGAPACLTPFQITSASAKDGKVFIQAWDEFNNIIMYVIIPGIEKITNLTGNKSLEVGQFVHANVYGIPDSYKFVHLGKRINLMQDAQLIQEKINAKFLHLHKPLHLLEVAVSPSRDLSVGNFSQSSTSITVKKSGDKYNMSGTQLNNIFDDDSQALLSPGDALFYITILGASLSRAQEILDSADKHGHITVANCKDLSSGLAKLSEAIDIDKEMEEICSELNRDLFKEAAALADWQKLNRSFSSAISSLPESYKESIGLEKIAGDLTQDDSVDTVLSLSFINPENLTTYLSNAERMEKTEDDLAQLLLLVRLGLDNINETAVQNSMKNLSDVNEGLRFISYMIKNKKNRSASV